MSVVGAVLGDVVGFVLGGADAVVPTNPTPRALLTDEDIWFDVADGARANFLVTPAGDWRVVTGVLALAQSLFRRTITNPGEWRTKPGYGVGLRQYIKAKDTPAMRSELTDRIRTQYLLDPRVLRVDAVTLSTFPDDQSGETAMRVLVQYTPRTQLSGAQPSTILIEVR